MKTKIILLALVATFAISMFSSCTAGDDNCEPCFGKKECKKEVKDSTTKN